MADNHESTMKWKVDITDLKAAMQEAKRSIKQANAEFKTATAGMDKWSKSTTGLEAKLSQLNKLLPAQKRQLEVLEAQYEETVKTMGENSSAATDLKLKIEEQKATIVKTETSIAKYTNNLTQMEAANNSLTSTVKRQESELNSLKKAYVDAVTQYGEGSDEAKELANQIESLSRELSDNKTKVQEAEKAADKFDHTLDSVGDSADDTEKEVKDLDGGFTVLKGTMANLAADAVRGLLNGFKKLGSAMIDVGKQAYEAYGQYEQLVGGVETLFGDSAKEVQKYAANAYKTAGMSANQYMETVTSFSASLLQGLNGDTAKAAKIADMAITDMSDNANKMGTSMEMIQNAYQGFAKQNFTMLDNLKLGYGGTKEEMLRLVKDAGVVNDSVKSINDVSFDQIIDAIHIVQTNMGITGTTAKEASETIEGSTQSVKASWENLMVAIADENADLYGSLQQFTGSVETMLQNAVPRIKVIVQGVLTSIRKLLRQHAPEFSREVLPVIEKIGKAVKDVGSFIIKNFSKIVPIVLSAVAAFTALNAVMAVQKTIQAVTKAIGALEVGVGLATKAQVGLNAAMSANPIGAVITAVAALVALIVTLASVESEAEKAHKAEMEALEEQAEQINANVESWDRLKESQQEAVNAGMTELNHYQSLYDELENITDANGRVKKGYEERASFITSQLSEALGIEIEMVGGVIKGYDNLKDSIDQVMAKKKAQIILDSQESLYAEAINKQGKALQDFRTIQDDYMTKQAEYTELEKKYIQEKSLAESAYDVETRRYHRDRMDQLAEQMTMKDEEVAKAEESYNKQQNLLSEYAYNIGLYETNMELAHAEKYDQMSTVTWDYVKDYQGAGEAQKQMLEDQIKNEETNLALLKELKRKSGSDIYDQQIRQSEERLAQANEEMKQYTSTTKTGMDNATIEWRKGLAGQLSEITGKKIEFRDAGNGNVQMVADGVKLGEAKPKKEMAKVISDVILEISKQKTGATTAGEDLIDGVNNGVANQNKQSSVFTTIANFGSMLLSKLRASLSENSPSKAAKEMGEYLLEGLDIGVKKKEKSTLQQISRTGKHILDTLNDELSQGVDMPLTGIKASMAEGLNALKSNVAIQTDSMLGNASVTGSGSEASGGVKQQVVNFNQYNTSPQPLNRLDIYRDTNNLLFSAKVRLNNV